MRRVSIASVACGVRILAQTENFNHVQWKMTLDSPTAAPGGTVLAHLRSRASIDGWHMYSLDHAARPDPDHIATVESPAVAKVTIFEPPPIRKFDPNFRPTPKPMKATRSSYARIELKKDAAPGDVTIAFKPRYQTCSGRQCIPPRTRDISAVLNVAAGAPVAAIAIPTGYIEAKPASASARQRPTTDSGSSPSSPWPSASASPPSSPPASFPMIPITMSYFSGSAAASRRRSRSASASSCCSPGSASSPPALGPCGVVQLGSNPWVNGFIALIFFVFGLSLLGAFEITIPSGILTRLNRPRTQAATLGTLLMGLTFALASFACVGPFMGTLLAASVTGGEARPILGMAVFATGLALPFFLLALFPDGCRRCRASANGWRA